MYVQGAWIMDSYGLIENDASRSLLKETRMIHSDDSTTTRSVVSMILSTMIQSYNNHTATHTIQI